LRYEPKHRLGEAKYKIRGVFVGRKKKETRKRKKNRQREGITEHSVATTVYTRRLAFSHSLQLLLGNGADLRAARHLKLTHTTDNETEKEKSELCRTRWIKTTANIGGRCTGGGRGDAAALRGNGGTRTD
jgi:hypothetical protein